MSWPRITRNAYDDAEGATRKFNLIRPSLGMDFAEALAAAFDVIGENPRQHACLETNQANREVRRVILRRFPVSRHLRDDR
jgi:hypothetical protein